jgi:hypothetical protein
MADNSSTKSNRDRLNERLRAKYADKNFDDDEAMYGQINDDYDNYDSQISGYKDREGKLADMFSKDPKSARFLTDWSKGEDPAVNLVRHYGTEIKDIIDDPARQEEMAKANQEYVERVAKNKELEKQYKANLKESLSMLDGLQQSEGLSDEDVDKAMDLLLQIIKDGVIGKFAVETIKMALKAINYDADVATAGDEGEVRGRNAKITEKLRKPQGGDGTAVLDGKNAGAPQQGSQRNRGMFALADEAM